MVTLRAEFEGEPSIKCPGRRSGQPAGNLWTVISVLVLLPLVFILFACTTDMLLQPLPRNGLAEVMVYLQPAPAQVRRVQLTVTQLGLTRSDGVTIPLTLNVEELVGSEIEGRQILLARGLVPPGSYTGVSFLIDSASVTREDGPAALLVPDGPIQVNASYDLGSSQVLTLFVSLEGAGLVRDGFEFTPSFSLDLPSRDLTSLIGYLAIPEADRITVFNRKTLRVTGALATGRTPQAMTVDGRSGLAYVALSGEDAVQVMDVFQGVMREKITLRNGDRPVDLDLTGDGRKLLTANYTSDTVSIVDPVLGLETERIRVDRGPTAVIVNESGTRAFAICSLSGSVHVLDLSAGILSATISLDETTPVDAALSSDEGQLFVISRDSPNLAVIDTNSLAITDRIYVGMGSTSIIVDDLTDLVLVARKNSKEIAFIDPSALMPVDAIKLQGAAQYMSLDRQENALFVSVPEKGVIQKVNLVSKRVMAEMETVLAPSEVAVVE